MKYLVIDQDGALHRREAADWTIALADVGPEGWNRVQLTRDLAAYVNDVGLVSDKYRRNVAAGLVLIAFGASRIPYAGPVVFVGWDDSATYRDEVEVTDLAPIQVAAVDAVYRTVVMFADLNASRVDSDEATVEVLELAKMISDGPVPGWDIHTLEL